jgi:nucleolar protein 15
MAKYLQQAAELRKRVREENESLGINDKAAAGKGTKRKAEGASETVDTGAAATNELSGVKSVSASGRKSKHSVAAGGAGAKDTKTGNKKAKKQTVNTSNVIYLGHIPNGFYEPEIVAFFKQFGTVQRVKLFRSQQTNNSKGYAFIEFESPDTAKVVAEAMDGYFMMERQLVSNVVPTDKLHEGMFKNKKPKDTAAAVDDSENEDNNDSISQRRSARRASSLKQKQQKLIELGIQYDFAGQLLA